MKEQTKKLYAVAARMGLVAGEDDPLHQIVYAVTGKEHVSELTEAEGRAVMAELYRRDAPKSPRPREEVPGMMTDGQQRYAWRLAYRLAELSENDTPANERLAGAVRKILNITASPKDPLRWVSREDGSKLIETMKRYVASAEKKARDG